MDRTTVDVYEQHAQTYIERRKAYRHERASAFASSLPRGAIRVDIGSGPGHYVPHLGDGLVALDAAHAMLAALRERHPGTPAVQADVTRLPLRGGAVGGTWASKILQHLPEGQLPGALAELHRVLPVGGRLAADVFQGDGVLVSGADDSDMPGRLFTLWQPERLTDLLVGAGFEQVRVALTADEGMEGHLDIDAVRAPTLADTVSDDVRLLVCGLNPSVYSAERGVGYARPGNRFWPAALAAGLVSRDRDADHALRHHRIGMTDVVKRATVAASELTRAEYRAGFARVDRLVRWLRPGAICFVGLAGWRAAVAARAQPGVQDHDLGGVPVYVMPSTSGLNAHSRLDELADHLRAAAALADARRHA